ncbi:hypothetical protein BT96DRAFT_289482 [Gymnopus androsaceus JB14]|uniref:Uncharacterized protein n=1 Tax=Gymnopus androsaceus JB14 TaxID=1447944 RepID=A0A6A4H2L2_9AGAR|nr:hypothetical protein BT96DRAFT_289482 [Gymnopus androsaceus JB14]
MQEQKMLLKVDGITVRHVWTLDALLPHVKTFEPFFHPNNCFVLDTMTRASYWWPNYNLTPPAKWPARFVAIPCPSELVLHWSTLYIGWAYQIGIVLSVGFVVNHLRMIGNIPAAIPLALHAARPDAVIDPILFRPGPVSAEATNNSYNVGDGHINATYSQQPAGFEIPQLLGHGDGAIGRESTLNAPVPGANPMEPAAWIVAPQSSVDNGYGATASTL